MDRKVNHHEDLYRRTGWALIVLLGLWIAAMLLALTLPAKLWKSGPAFVIFFDGIFPALFVATIVLSIVRIVSYVRWTGKYPYYFLFGKAHGSGNPVGKEREGERSKKNGAV